MVHTFPTLYKKSSSGKVMKWSLSVKKNEKQHDRDSEYYDIVTEHGYVDGAMQYDYQQVFCGKNIGRSNETTIEEQALAEATSKWKKQKDRGYTEDPSGEANMEVILPMLAQKYKERKKYIKFPCYVQPKLNGMRCISYIKDGARVYQSRLGKYIFTLDHLTKDLESLSDLVLDGEIYLHGMALQDIVSLVKNQDTETIRNNLTVKDLEYWVYDCVSPLPFEERHKLLSGFDGRVKLLQTFICHNVTELENFHKKFLEDGYEGTIIRNANGLYAIGKRSNDLQKYKPVLDGEFKIVGGYMVETGREQGTCIFTCITNSGKRFDVRPKGTLERRKQYWRDLSNDMRTEPCSSPDCRSHVTKPCDKCGKQWGTLKLLFKMLSCEFQEWTAEGKPFHARGVAVRDYE